MSRPRSKATKSRLREALAKKQIRTAHWDIPLEDSDTTRAAAKSLQEAKQTAFVASLGDNDALKQTTRKTLAAAQRVHNACSYRIELRAIPDADRDALRNTYPEDEKLKLTEDPFNYHLLAASVVDGDMTGEEWFEEMSNNDRWRDPDRVELLALAIDVNYRPYSHGIPKE